jgi:hypothetical protein
MNITTGTTNWAGLAFSDTTATRGAVLYDHGTGLGGAADTMYFQVAGGLKASINSAGTVNINDLTTNANMTVGLTINQGANDDTIQAWKSSDVTIPMTVVAEADTFGQILKAGATTGGLVVQGLSSGVNGLLFRSEYTTSNTTKTTSGDGAVSFFIRQSDGGTGLKQPGADDNLFVIGANGVGTRFIFDVEGSAFADVEWTTYGKHDDLSVIRDMESELLAHEGASQTSRRHYMESTGIIGQDSWHMENGIPRAMVNFTKLSMLHHGALIQIGDRFISNEERIDYQQEEIESLKKELRLLEGCSIMMEKLLLSQ